MDLLLLGAGMGVVGGMIPCPLHFIALTQVALNRWMRAILILVGPPVAVDGGMLLVTIFFYHYIPSSVAHYVAYLGGAVLIGFASYSLSAARGKTQAEMANSNTLTYASVTTATLTELTAPGTWIYWMTVAGPILSEGRLRGYWHVVPFFVGGLVGYYGAAVVTLRVLAWGARLHKRFHEHLFLAANVLLFFLGISYLVRAYFGR
jgi:hypothetical protein